MPNFFRSQMRPKPKLKASAGCAPAAGSVADVEEGMRLILAKMQAERPTLRQYLRSRAAGESKSSREWEEAHPGCTMAAWRSGAAYAYGDIERMIERNEFSPEPPNGQAQSAERNDWICYNCHRPIEAGENWMLKVLDEHVHVICPPND